jgi:processive 1,2-diacylglycerol beta-glucosyltransferase
MAAKRILIATVTAGAGHVQAAAALEEAWRILRPKDDVQRCDVMDFTPKLYRKAYVEGYVKLVEHAPELWAMMFKKTDNPRLMRKLTRLRRALAGASSRRFLQSVRAFRPDAVLCTHFLPPEILGGWREERSTGRRPKLASIVTDFEAHALWIEPSVDLYAVAQEETRAGLIARGIPPEQVIATGIPVAAKFRQPIEAGAVRRRLGLRDDLPVLLVLSGGFGMGPVREILENLDRVKTEVQVVVVCGKNESLRRDLAVRSPRHPTHVLGFVSNMQELMAIAAIILTKPGGLTCSEALALGRPIFVLNPIPGQETANCDFLLEHGAAAKANRLEEIPFRLEKLLGSTKLCAMSDAALDLGRPAAAERICQAVVDRFLTK